MLTINRKQFLQGLAAGTAALSLDACGVAPGGATAKRPRAITMWDFSWLERRWPGGGYEDWERALDGLVERGYNAVRIDAYPHLVAEDPERSWILKPVWNVQDWGAPGLIKVRVVPALHRFIAACRDRDIKVGLSTWFREDRDNVRMRITGPEQHAAVWNKTLAGIKQAGLLDTILFVDLCNEWPGPLWAPFINPPLDWGAWRDPRAMHWMRTAIGLVRTEFPELPLLFSTNGLRAADYQEADIGFIDAIEHHMWMASEHDGEFYSRVGYQYERFSEDGYRNVQLKAATAYAEKPAYWQKLLTDQIAAVAAAARHAKQPLMTTECWGIIDYKDWPLLPWDWVKQLCAIGTRAASASGQWSAVATSNFCGPQFAGMWRDVAWHRALTDTIKSGPMDASVRAGRLWDRL